MNDKYGKFWSYQTKTPRFAYSKKQDQSVQLSYYSIMNILFIVMSFSLPINTTSNIEEWEQTSAENKSHESRNERKEKH